MDTRKLSLFVIILFVLAGCGRNKQSDDTLITIDLTDSYPQKELILQDFMDVEYIPLETTDDFLCQGRVLDVGKDIMLVKNNIDDGEIFVFDRKGKALRKINRKGSGGEEYTYISGIVLDEDNGELFVYDSQASKFLIYDLYGKFKRSFSCQKDVRHSSVYNYDANSLICDDNRFTTDEGEGTQLFFILSKQDGNVVEEIRIPYKQGKSPMLIRTEENRSMAVMPSYRQIVPYDGDWNLFLPSSDTIFRYSPDQQLIPLLIRTPSIQFMSPEVFLFPGIFTDRYYFMETIKKEYNFESRAGFPRMQLVYDRQEKAIYECIVYNQDYSDNRIENLVTEVINGEIAFRANFEAFYLLEAYEKGQLKGQLKEIAAQLDEEANPVIMLAKYKK